METTLIVVEGDEMKKVILSIFVILALVISTVGCVDMLFGDSKKLQNINWVRSDGEQTVVLNENGQGSLIGENGYSFEWTMDDQRERTMIWVVYGTGETVLVKYFLVADDRLMVLEFSDGVAWAYHQEEVPEY